MTIPSQCAYDFSGRDDGDGGGSGCSSGEDGCTRSDDGAVDVVGELEAEGS